MKPRASLVLGKDGITLRVNVATKWVSSETATKKIGLRYDDENFEDTVRRAVLEVGGASEVATFFIKTIKSMTTQNKEDTGQSQTLSTQNKLV